MKSSRKRINVSPEDQWFSLGNKHYGGLSKNENFVAVPEDVLRAWKILDLVVDVFWAAGDKPLRTHLASDSQDHLAINQSTDD